ncbi:ATP-grasp domain-containing protein [Archangium gephyra]|uniref:ATP-grasp domain-containing protein n=1 Tax=Archangium gephyra TaxID=48 RepID=A0AAC8Q7M8_9BACT|nr:ATP-grasp domain-containing protein [Archangium gephyra]AKJ02553.1 Carbamoylphosphate synthase large subunit [Archangium gephyra]REG28526.1 ATP-grasp domain-containing protein [Archangium gephyra]
MNVVFISPQFPPQFFHFVTALRSCGVNVLGIGDAPYDALRPELREGLSEYFFTPRLDDYDALLRAVGYFTWRHGRIDRIDSLNETWLEVEARLREDFHVPGLLPADIARLRSKQGMHDVFKGAGVPHPDAIPVKDAEGVKAFARRVGYPLVLKPDVGVGAARTFKVSSDAEVDAAFGESLSGYVAQAFVRGTIVTYDGLVDRDGQIIFVFSHEYSDGIMESVLEQRDLAIWSHKEIPPALDKLGRKAVAVLGLRERWFHLEFFRLSDGSYVALEANLRPPGAYLPDMMNYACDIDVYRLWARMLAGEDVRSFRYEPKYHVCHAGRRSSHQYRYGHQEVVKRLGASLLLHREMPVVYRSALGDEMYLTRHQELPAMQDALRFIQQTRA